MTARNAPVNSAISAPSVLFIAPQPFFQWRGSPIRVAFDVQALAELGYQVDLLTFPFGEDKTIPGVRIIRVPNFLGLKNIGIGPSIWKALYDIPLLVMALGLVLRKHYAVVHTVEEAGALGVLISAAARSKLIFEKHSDPDAYRGGWLRNLVMSCYARLEAFAIHHADAVIATGAALVEQVRRIDAGKPAHHIFDIPSSTVEADPEKVTGIRRQLQQRADDVLIMYVGSFETYQGIDLLFESIPRVVRANPTARFAIIGGTPVQIARRTRQLEASGSAAAVTFLGKIPPDQLPSYLTSADILLSPRVAGVNTPLKLLDYLKAGRAIVACDNEANRRILSRQHALLVQPEPEPFAEAIGRLIQNAGLRAELGRNSQGLIRERYNFATFRDRLKTCYDEAQARSPAPRPSHLLALPVLWGLQECASWLLTNGLEWP